MWAEWKKIFGHSLMRYTAGNVLACSEVNTVYYKLVHNILMLFLTCKKFPVPLRYEYVVEKYDFLDHISYSNTVVC